MQMDQKLFVPTLGKSYTKVEIFTSSVHTQFQFVFPLLVYERFFSYVFQLLLWEILYFTHFNIIQCYFVDSFQNVVIVRGYGLNLKCPPQVHVSGYFVASWESCYRRLCYLEEGVPLLGGSLGLGLAVLQLGSTQPPLLSAFLMQHSVYSRHSVTSSHLFLPP